MIDLPTSKKRTKNEKEKFEKKLSDFSVRPISYGTAMDSVIKNHYLHRKCSCVEAFGLFDGEKTSYDFFDTGNLVGVIVFGKPSSFTLCNGICGKDESKNVIEFNRMWVSENMPKNTESFFIGKAIKMCSFDIIVSFADIEQGHTGYIYQATNWLYTGISPKMKYFRLKKSSCTGGPKYRRRERMTKEKIINDFGENMIEEYFSSPKHRYIYFNCDKRRKEHLLKKLRYRILPYPKA